jgi:hypothetical protein
MSTLNDTEVWPGSAISGRISFASRNVSLASSDGVEIDFEIASKGGGFTRIVVALGKDDFPAILETMSNANRQAAMKALVNELPRQIVE